MPSIVVEQADLDEPKKGFDIFINGEPCGWALTFAEADGIRELILKQFERRAAVFSAFSPPAPGMR